MRPCRFADRRSGFTTIYVQTPRTGNPPVKLTCGVERFRPHLSSDKVGASEWGVPYWLRPTGSARHRPFWIYLVDDMWGRHVVWGPSSDRPRSGARLRCARGISFSSRRHRPPADQIQRFHPAAPATARPAGDVSGGGLVRAEPPQVPPAGALPRARRVLPALAPVLSPLLQHPRLRRAACFGLAGHMGSAAVGGVEAVRVVADGTSACSVEEKRVRENRLLRRAQPAAT